MPDFDSLKFRQVMGRFATGITVVTTAHEGETHGMTVNSFMSVSLEPPLVLVSVDHRAKMHQVLPLSQRYGVSILDEHHEVFSRHFAGRPIEGLHIPFAWVQGVPLIAGALAFIVARVVDAHLAGDHTLYIAEVEYLDFRDGAPVLYYAGQYRRLSPSVETVADAPEIMAWL